jgi:group I intron endonuclease
MIVYCTTNKTNGKKYIGSDSKNDPKYYGSGVNIKKAIKKHGRENFVKQILCEVDTVDLMKELEEYWIDYFDAYNNPLFYNATKYAAGISSFPEHKKINISIANKGNKYHTGHKQTEYQKEQTKKANTGKKHTEEFKALKKQKAIGNQYALGNILTLEQCNKISLKKINHSCYSNPERNKKISESLKNRPKSSTFNPRLKKPILQYDLDGIFIKEWNSGKEAATSLNLCQPNINACCNNKIPKYKGFIWKFKKQ